MIVVAILSLLAAIAIPNLIHAKIQANEASARATLRNIANALESYATLNGVYPTDPEVLLGADPPYLPVDYFSGVHGGYVFTKDLQEYSYTVTATPVNGNSGTKTFVMETGVVLSEQ